ncbi:MAG: hypothetical protein AAF682_06160 [Planctomycetota bacterium]
MTRHPLRTALLLLSAAAASCHQSSSSNKNAAPSVQFTAPLTAISVDVGAPVEIRWISEDPDSDALTTILAVGLDHPGSAELVVDADEAGGAEQVYTWTPAAGLEGTYAIRAVIDDGAKQTEATAPGTVAVGVVASVSGASLLAENGLGQTVVAFPGGEHAMMGLVEQGAPVVLDPGGPNETLLASERMDGFVAKYAPDGGLLWAAQSYIDDTVIYDESSDGGFGSLAFTRDVIALPDGGVLVDYVFQGRVTIGLGTPAEATFETGITDPRDVLARYDAAGELVWAMEPYAVPLDEEGAEEARLEPFGDDAFVMVGTRYSQMVFGLGEPNETVLPEASSCGFLAGFSLDGSLTFANGLYAGATGYVERAHVRVHANEIVVAGAFAGTATFGAGEPEEVTLSSTDGDAFDGLLARFDAGGGLLWARVVAAPTGPANDGLFALDLAIDDGGALHVLSELDDQGASYAFGLGQPTEVVVDTEEGKGYRVVTRYDASGQLEWNHVLAAQGGFDDDEEDDMWNPARLAPVPGGGVATVGLFDDELSIDGAPPILVEAAPGFGELFVARFNAAGGTAFALNDGGTEVYLTTACIAPLEDRLVILLSGEPEGTGLADFGTNEGAGESVFLPVFGVLRAVYGFDGVF